MVIAEILNVSEDPIGVTVASRLLRRIKELPILFDWIAYMMPGTAGAISTPVPVSAILEEALVESLLTTTRVSRTGPMVYGVKTSDSFSESYVPSVAGRKGELTRVKFGEM